MSYDGRESQMTEARRIKKKIIEAASQLYEKKGLYETSVAEIAEVAGISVPVTYQYVHRKADILLLIMEDFTEKFIQRVEPELETAPDPEEKLKRALRVFTALVDEDLAKVVLVYRQSRALDKAGRSRVMAAETAHVQVFERILTEGIEKGVFQAPDVNLIAYHMVMTGHTWALKQWHFGRRMNLETFIEKQTDCILHALKA
jgi:AcrR family transcriptional regulator